MSYHRLTLKKNIRKEKKEKRKPLLPSRVWLGSERKKTVLFLITIGWSWF
jgi:hypothetical protein